jgi:hypothetical protein
LLFAALLSPSVWAAVYCVSTSSGNDLNNGISTSGAGTPCLGTSAPWKTIAHFNAQTFNPDDVILFKAGDGWRETSGIVMPSSGTSGHPITLGRYGAGANPIIHGSAIESGWSLDLGNVYKTTPVGFSDQVFQDGARLVRVASRIAMTAGSFFFDSGTNTTYIWCTDSANPSTHVIADDSVGSLINFNGKSWINVSSIDAEGSANNGYDFQQVIGAHDITVTGAVSSFNVSRGFSIGGYTGLGTSNIAFTNCVGHDNLNEAFWIGNGTNNGCTNCEAYNNGKDVANGYAGSNGNGILIGISAINNYILFSYVHDTFFGFPIIEEDENHAGRVKPVGSLIAFNYILNNAAALTASAELEGMAGAFANNWIVTTGSGVGKSVRLHSQGGIAGPSTNELIVGNSFYQGVTASSTIFNPEATTVNFTFENNKLVFATTGGAAGDAISWGSGATGTSDYNSFQNTEFCWGATGAFPQTLTAWRTASGQDAHSVVGSAAGYVSTIAPFNLALTAGAPEIDAGLNLGASYQLGLDPTSTWPANADTQNQSWYGAGWDIGATVYTAASQCAISITSPSSGTATGPTTFGATSTSCPSANRFEWKLNGQPLMGDGTFEYSYSLPACSGGTCTSSYFMPSGFGPYNMSYNWDGVYPLTVQALNASGTVLATSAAVNLTVTDYGLGGTCSLTAPNFASPQSGTISITNHCPGVSGTGVFANSFFTLYVDGKLITNFSQAGFADHTFSFDTTTLEDTKHLVWVSVTTTKVNASQSQGDIGNSPALGAWGVMTTANGAVARELRLNFNKCFLWLGGVSTCSLSARTTKDDNSEVATNATFTTSDASVATVASCTSVASCTITGVANGVAKITATGTNGLVETAWITVYNGTPIFPHFGTDGSYCTVYNQGNCSPNKSFLVRMMFDNGDTTNGDLTLRAEEVRAGYNVFQHSVYPQPAYNSYPSFASWQTSSHQYFTGANGIDAILASGFKAFMPSCASMFHDGQSGQSSSDGNGASSDGHGFAARLAYLMTDLQGKTVGCLSPDEDPIPLIQGFGSGQMGAANSPSQIVVSGGTATMTWPGASGTQYHIDITGATNTCFNGTNITTSGGIGGPFTFATSCGNGTYNSGTDPNLVVSIYNELCPVHPCQSYGPLNIPIPNSILQTIQTGLHAATPPAAMGFSWAGGAPTSIYKISASVADYTDIYFTWSTAAPDESWGVNRGYPNGRTIRLPLLSIEHQFWDNAWPGMDRTKPFYQLTHTGDGPWFSRGGKTFTLGATSGSTFTTTTANNAVVGAKITVTGATCTGNYFDIATVTPATNTFTVTQSPACSGSGGTVIIAPKVNYFVPPMDRYKQPPIRGVENAAQLWDAYALGAAGNRTFQFAIASGAVSSDYPCDASSAYVFGPTGCPPNSPQLEACNTGNTYVFTDNPGAQGRWQSNALTQNLIGALEPQIIQPLCNAPDLGQRIHTGAKCGANGKLVIAISDFEVPTTINFPASLWSLYNVGNAPVTRFQEIKGAYVNVTNLAANSTSDTFTAEGGEIDIWWFPSGSTPLAQAATIGFNPASVGATQTALRYSYLCNPATFVSNLDQRPTRTVFTSATSISLFKVPGIPLCYDYQYLDASNNPVGVSSNVQALQ